MAIGLGASWFEFSGYVARPRIPFSGADRLVRIRSLDEATRGVEPRIYHDFGIWREEVESVVDLTPGVGFDVNLVIDDGRLVALEGARVTESFFRLTGMSARVGRALTEEDYQPTAAPVAVIGYDAWQGLFEGDAGAVGRTVRMGADPVTIVGVMPERFGFPYNHEIWLPLRESAVSQAPRGGPSVQVLGHLAPGVSLEQAQVELETVGRRLAAELPETHARLITEVDRYPPQNEFISALINVPFFILFGIISANVAALLFARTVSRQDEIAMRSALGASRARLVTQLAVEALAVTAVAAVIGIGVATWTFPRIMALFWDVQDQRPPFWVGNALSPLSILYACLLPFVGAAIIGVLPGLRVTRHLRQSLPKAASAMPFGGFATVVIVVQVAVCVAFIPLAIRAGQANLDHTPVSDFPATSFLTGRVTLEPSTANGASGELEAAIEEAGPAFDEMRRRLAAEPGVLGVTLVTIIPGLNHPTGTITIEGNAATSTRVRTLGVDSEFFEMMGTTLVGGRLFRPEDATTATCSVVVERGWATSSAPTRSADASAIPMKMTRRSAR